MICFPSCVLLFAVVPVLMVLCCLLFVQSLRTEIGPKYKAEISMVCPGVVATNINTRRLGNVPFQFDMKKGNVMSVAEAARKIMDGVAAGERELHLTPMITAGRWVRLFAPELMDLGAIRFMKTAQHQPGQT